MLTDFIARWVLANTKIARRIKADALREGAEAIHLIAGLRVGAMDCSDLLHGMAAAYEKGLR